MAFAVATTSEPKGAWSPELRQQLEHAAHAAGFDLVGVATVGVPEAPAEQADAARFAAWIDAGHAGEMEYLKRRDTSGALVRSGLQLSLPWAQSVIVCAINYRDDAPLSIGHAPPGTGWIARYARSGRRAGDGATLPTDYHDELLARLRQIEAALRQQADFTTRCYVDTGPLLERGLAARAGIGWIGKNTCVLNQQLGSWLLLGVIVTSLLLPEEPAIAQLSANDRCGTCTRCIDACPTSALLATTDPAAPRQMDATRCIAYLTIEKKGSIDPALRERIGRNVFGCDICQEVCPWNDRASRTPAPPAAIGMEPRPELLNPTLDWLASLDSREFKRQFKGSPLERTGRRRLHRNVAIAMGNTRDPRFLPQLAAWAEPQPEPTPSNASPDDPVLREAALWARDQITHPRSS